MRSAGSATARLAPLDGRRLDVADPDLPGGIDKTSRCS
jgi:hypothetical protein